MKNISVSHVITWLTEASCLYAAPTQSSNSELIRPEFTDFFISEKAKSTKTSPLFGVTSDKTLAYQRAVVIKLNIAESDILSVYLSSQ